MKIRKRRTIKLNFSTNLRDIIAALDRAIAELSDLTGIMQEVGEELKEEVLNPNNWDADHELRHSGQLLSYLESETPQPQGQGTVVSVGFGQVSKLNNIHRPARMVGHIHLRAGDFPYWLVLEYGMLGLSGKGNQEADRGPHGKKFRVSSEHRLVRLVRLPSREPALDTFGKPGFMMVRAKNPRRPHPGVRPTRMFRNGLYKIMTNQAIERRLEAKFKDAMQIRAVRKKNK